MPIAIAYPIEGHWQILILILLVIEFNPYNVCALFYNALAYGEIFIFP